MIDIKYFKERYIMTPLRINADLSNAALELALVQLDFKLDLVYTLCLSKNYIKFAHNILAGLGTIEIEVCDNLENFWYVVDETNKKIIYSTEF
jgi:hypothetical protein